MSKTFFDKSAVFTQLEIQLFDAGATTPTQSLKVTDADSIKPFLWTLSKISAEGGGSVPSLRANAPAVAGDGASSTSEEKIVVLLGDVDQKLKIEILDGRFKTPDGTLNADERSRKAEEQMRDEIVSTLKPALNKKIFKFANVDFNFGDFTLTYKGSKRFDHAPVTLSGSEETYEVKDKAGQIQKLTVTMGQRPPQPVEFKVNDRALILETFRSPTYGAILGYLEIHEPSID